MSRNHVHAILGLGLFARPPVRPSSVRTTRAPVRRGALPFATGMSIP